VDTITIKDKNFSISITAAEINVAVSRLADELNNDLHGKSTLFIVVLNGSFMFASDLFKLLSIPCEISFIRLSSYSGTNSTAKVNTILGLTDNIKDRTIVVIEDIVDTGNTLEDILMNLEKHHPAEITICTLLFKPDAYKKNIKLDYVGMTIPNEFIIGYGLDYDGYGRNLPDIYKLENRN
jgi:hypoxanthine phosphoribosyltransferase